MLQRNFTIIKQKVFGIWVIQCLCRRNKLTIIFVHVYRAISKHGLLKCYSFWLFYVGSKTPTTAIFPFCAMYFTNFYITLFTHYLENFLLVQVFLKNIWSQHTFMTSGAGATLGVKIEHSSL